MRTVGVKLRMETGDYVRDTATAGAATDKLKGKLSDAGVKGKADLDKLALGVGLVGAGLVAVAGIAVHSAMVFDKQMSEVGAVANATAGEMDELRKAAIEAGAATVFSARDAAQAEAELAKAGISTADILSGALTGSLDLASAGSLSLADSATIAASAMNTFGLAGDDVSHIADVLAAGANKSAANVEDLGLALQQVGLVAAQNNLTLDETVAVLSAMADRGLRGSDAGTSLKTALQRLSAPMDKARELMEALGISMYDANGNIVSIVDVAGQLQTTLKDLAPAQRNAALQTIFGSDAIRAGNVLYGEGAAGIREYIEAVDDQGAASRVAAQKLDNLAGDVEQLKGSLETLFITSGAGAGGGLRILAQSATTLVNTFAGLPGPVQSGAVVFAGLSGAALLAVSAGLKLRGRLHEIVKELNEAGPAGVRAARGIELTAKWAGRAAIAFGALTIAGEIIGATFGDDVRPQVDALSDSLAEWGKSGKAAGEAARLFGQDLTDLNYDLGTLGSGGLAKTGNAIAGLVESIPGLASAFDQSLAKAKERIAALDMALTQLQEGGHADEAAQAFMRIWQEAQKAGISLEDLQAGFPQYIASVSKGAKGTNDLADAQANAAATGEDLLEVWGKLHGTMLNADEAMLDAKKAIDDVAESFKENGDAVAGNSEAALENRIALEKAAKAAAEAAQKYQENGGSADGARKIMDDFRRAAEKATGATGKEKDAVHKLADELFKLPTQVQTTIKLKTSGMAQLERVINELDRLGGAFRWGGITHADVGLLRDASVYAPRSPAIYAFAEPATQGEAFVPRKGNYGRSMSVLSAAAGWYNADVVPRGAAYAGGSGGVVGHVDVRVRVEDPRGRVLHETLTTYAVDTGKAPADLWPARRR